ncbi:putative nad dependent epimerase dehydratase family protein [Diaporthe ampelina]|uniref:Putative nad dependent epimerase dehydratase family protein n=1 Tax=Diaporthe ampelina TaxID=1214573 RepID=A0A0G2FI34_9PEZI|nr:putative nad dependent epimerase dehydratase family protein [Diaporthe ampelina]
MASPPTPKILLLGATGYIGGTVLHYLTQSAALARCLPISVLVRGADRADKLKSAYGDQISTVPLTTLDDLGLITRLASEHDIVVNAGTGFHPASAEALVHGLAKRKAATAGGNSGSGEGGSEVPQWIIHTSGCSNIADNPLAGDRHPEGFWLDDGDPLRTYELERDKEARGPYLQRTAELAVLEAGERLGVGATSLQSPAVFGPGRGLFSAAESVVPTMLRFVLDQGYGCRLGDGTAQMGFVHVDDLAALYVRVVEEVVGGGGRAVPSGRGGIVFASVGMVKLVDIARDCVGAVARKGIIQINETKEVIKEVDLDTVAPYFGGGDLGRHIAAVGWAGHWNTVGKVGEEKLGWKPAHRKEAWHDHGHFDRELNAVLEGKRPLSLDKITGQKK